MNAITRLVVEGVVAIGLVVACIGCDTGPKSARGFSLPDGDAQSGKRIFVELKCTACHTVKGLELPALEETPEISVALGGTVTRIKTYGELVSSIINPSHRLACGYPPEIIKSDEHSKMTNYNDVLTVAQLVDLVAFLQSQYELRSFEPTSYPMYY